MHDSYVIPAGSPAQRNRAKELIDNMLVRYKVTQQTLKSDQSINLICSVDGLRYDLYSIAAPSIDTIHATGKVGDECYVSIAPVEQVSFTMVVSNKKPSEPPREIGFKAVFDPVNVEK